MTHSPEVSRTDLERALRTATFAVNAFASRHADDLGHCVPRDRDAVLLRVALTHLAGLGIIAIAPLQDWPDQLPAELDETYAGDLHTKLAQAVAAHPTYAARTRGESRASHWPPPADLA